MMEREIPVYEKYVLSTEEASVSYAVKGGLTPT